MSVANATILVTGAGGSIGSVLTKKLLASEALKVRALDVDEYSLSKLVADVEKNKLERLETCLGDVKDATDVEQAVRGCDIVIHLAAVKMVDISSLHPIPCIKTNVDGTINLVNEAFQQKVRKFMFVSSDKAVDFASVYGATKFLGERIVLWANRYSSSSVKFSVCRFGNVIQSRGNVWEIWEQQKKGGLEITVTHEEMERFFWNVSDAVDFILKTIEIMQGGEIFIAKMPSFKIIDLARQVSSNIKFIGLRPEETLKHKLIADYEKDRLEEHVDMWVIRQ